jgi:hypothetical protein
MPEKFKKISVGLHSLLKKQGIPKMNGLGSKTDNEKYNKMDKIAEVKYKKCKGNPKVCAKKLMMEKMHSKKGKGKGKK